MKRDEYVPFKHNDFDVSTKNEPFIDTTIEVDVRLYPDMYKAYNNFSATYGISRENFILTNGCESALRIAMLAIRPGKLSIECPTWARVQVECEALGIPYDFVNYKYKDGIFSPEREVVNDLYTTDTYNNLFQHDNVIGYSKTILDETYTSRMLFANEKVFNKNTIIIGSFSKTVGAGLRLGYCIFSNEWTDRFNLLREQYVSATACEWLDSYQILMPQLKSIDIPYRIVTKHPVYTTVEAKTLSIPHKHFIVSETDFCRFGNTKDMSALEKELQHGLGV